jgi:hypothetical protein
VHVEENVEHRYLALEGMIQSQIDQESGEQHTELIAASKARQLVDQNTVVICPYIREKGGLWLVSKLETASDEVDMFD